MKNILFVHSSSELYGSDRSLLNILNNIDNIRFGIYVILPCDGPLVTEIRKLDNVQVDIFEVAVLRRKNLSIKGGVEYIQAYNASVRYLKRYIREHHIDIVDTNTAVVFPGAIAARKCHIKSAWHIREIIKSNLENKVISFIMNRYSDVIIANSKSTGQALNVRKELIKVVYNAVTECDDDGIRNHETLTVGMAGRINRWKGQKLFIDAASIVHEKMPDVQFVIAGEVYVGEDAIREDIVDYISAHNLANVVKLLGQVDDMDSFYRSIDIFVLPSIQPEPFGLVVIEAMEHSLSVIATNHGGPSEIITNGKDGYLVDYQSAEEMAECIYNLLKDESKRTEIGQMAKQSKRSRFSVDAMVKNIEEIFEQL